MKSPNHQTSRELPDLRILKNSFAPLPLSFLIRPVNKHRGKHSAPEKYEFKTAMKDVFTYEIGKKSFGDGLPWWSSG